MAVIFAKFNQKNSNREGIYLSLHSAHTWLRHQHRALIATHLHDHWPWFPLPLPSVSGRPWKWSRRNDWYSGYNKAYNSWYQNDRNSRHSSRQNSGKSRPSSPPPNNPPGKYANTMLQSLYNSFLRSAYPNTSTRRPPPDKGKITKLGWRCEQLGSISSNGFNRLTQHQLGYIPKARQPVPNRNGQSQAN